MFGPEDAFWLNGEPFTQRCAWIDLVQMAAYTGYRYRGIDELKRGEFVASVRFLAERWQWSKSSVQRWLTRVEKAGRIAGQRMGQHGMIYLLVNYDTYNPAPSQSGTPADAQAGTQVGQERDTSGTNEKKEKKVNKGKELIARSTRAGRETWATPYALAWSNRYGCEIDDVPVAEFVHDVRALENKHGPPETLKRWTAILAATPAQYAKGVANKLRSTWGNWGEEGAPATNGANGGDPLLAKAAALWNRYVTAGLTRPGLPLTEQERIGEQLVAEGAYPNLDVFKTELRVTMPWDFFDARSDEWAIRQMRDRMAAYRAEHPRRQKVSA
jgi:hypothetical protein